MSTEARKEFAEWLRQQVDKAGGLRAAADKAGVAHSTLIRALEGDTLSLTTMEAISGWTGVRLATLLEMYGMDVDRDRRTELAIARILDQNPRLRETLEVAAQVLDDEAMQNIVEYIEFQTELKRRDR